MRRPLLSIPSIGYFEVSLKNPINNLKNDEGCCFLRKVIASAIEIDFKNGSAYVGQSAAKPDAFIRFRFFSQRSRRLIHHSLIDLLLYRHPTILILRELCRDAGKNKHNFLNHLSIQTPVLDRFRNVRRANILIFFQIRNRPCNLQDAIVCPGRKPEPVHGGLHQ